MRYRALTAAQSHEIVDVLSQGNNFGVKSVALERGDGELFDEDLLQSLLEPFKSEMSRGDYGDAEKFEGKLAEALHDLFKSVPVEVLDDRAFWRYLAVEHFWWYTSVRESEPIAKGNYRNLVDVSLPAEQIPFRLFLRTKAVDVDGDVAIAGEIAASTDFWRSHITRVRVSSAPRVARAFSIAKRDDATGKLNTTGVRKVARRLNRAWANTNLDTYSEEDAQIFLNELIDEDLT